MNPAIIIILALIVLLFVLFGSALAKPLGRLIKGETKKWKKTIDEIDVEIENTEDI